MFKRALLASAIISLLAAAARAQIDSKVYAMQDAARKGDIPKIKELMQQGVSLESRSDRTQGYTPLMHAAGAADAKTVQALLDLGADAKATAVPENVPKGFNVLHAAYNTTKDRTEKFRLLLAAGANPNAVDDLYGNVWECLLNTSSSDELLQLLIDKGLDVNATGSDGRSNLWFAAAKARPTVVAMLLKAHANAAAVSAKGQTTLMGAAYGAEYDAAEVVRCIQFLAAAGADPKAIAKDGRTALHPASWQAHTKESAKILTALIDAGCDVNQPDAEGMTPLLLVASRAEHDDPIRALIHAKADIKAVDKAGNGVVHYAVSLSPRVQNYDVLSCLAKVKADFDLKNKLGRTPLMAACLTHRTDIVETLIDLGANVNGADNEGWTPLLLAIGATDKKLLSTWLNAESELLTGKKPSPDDDLKMMAHLGANAAFMGQPERCLTLLRHGARDAKTKDGTTLATLLANRTDPEADAIRKLVALYKDAPPPPPALKREIDDE